MHLYGRDMTISESVSNSCDKPSKSRSFLELRARGKALAPKFKRFAPNFSPTEPQFCAYSALKMEEQELAKALREVSGRCILPRSVNRH